MDPTFWRTGKGGIAIYDKFEYKPSQAREQGRGMQKQVAHVSASGSLYGMPKRGFSVSLSEEPVLGGVPEWWDVPQAPKLKRQTSSSSSVPDHRDPWRHKGLRGAASPRARAHDRLAASPRAREDTSSSPKGLA